MGQYDYLILSEDGKTVIDCRKSYEGVVIIPNGVTKIGYGAFMDCLRLTTIVIPCSVTEIADSAFRNCLRLTSIDIPCGVKCIEDLAFWDCKNLASIIIPGSVKVIGVNAFVGCSGLLVLHLRHKKPIDFTEAFDLLDLSKITLYVPIGSEYAYSHHPFYSKFAKIVTEK